MSGFNVTIPKDTIKINDNSLEFEIKGDPKYGLDKTIVNGIRRVLLSSLPSVAFRTGSENPDLVMVKNMHSVVSIKNLFPTVCIKANLKQSNFTGRRYDSCKVLSKKADKFNNIDIAKQFC